MALRYLLDTDIIIWHLRGHEPTEALLQAIEREQPLSCSALTIFEVWSGVRPREEEATRRFLDTLYQIPTGGPIPLIAAEYWRNFRSQGITLGRADALVGATARALDLMLVTYNCDHYPMDDIALYDPMPSV
ncbi:MAG: type II toxin-antitoxin system VapC family toxin [Gemmatimonadetes bacterium]|jgi:predicted nucleic acid-binding protein|nr:type II toxin-antitoxin system VapC family toxin [Gemmatimonadota bacterium]